MSRFVVPIILALSMAISGLQSPARAQNYELLFQDFNARNLTYNERRYLQTALAFEGHYFGLLDGDWGRLSRTAMTRYSRQEFGTASEDWHMAMLTLGFFERNEANGWNMRYFPVLGMSVMLPQKALIEESPTEHLLNYRHRNSSLSVSIGRHSQSTASYFHRYTMDAHAAATTPYSVRKNNFAVSSATLRDGSSLYARSQFINGAWSTIMVSANARDKTTFNAVTSSIAKGRTAPLDITEHGKLMQVVKVAFQYAEQRQEQQAQSAAPQKRPEPKEKSGGSTGTGFIVSSSGHVLTNAHVVDGCGTFRVDGVPATLVDASDVFDLALLKTTIGPEKSVAVFSASPAKLNSDVTVVGYPYAQLLGGLNVTRGSVSSLTGLGGDATRLQITAPVQSGNSGGPLIASDGEVVGVIVSKLDALLMARNNGDVPQNINFAIRGEIAKVFLAQNQIEPRLSLTNDRLAPEDLATRAATFTTFIECR